MKQNMKIILFSCLIGATLAGIFFLSVKEKAEAKNKPIAYAFQVGVFKKEENASTLASNYKSAKVIKDKEYYRVFIGLTIHNKEELRDKFNQEHYNYYIKELEITEEEQMNIEKMDEMYKKSTLEDKTPIIAKTWEYFRNEL